jgi:phosphomannomutase
MYGSGRNVLADIFKTGIQHVQIRSEVNPLFPGINPEPIEPHVRAGEIVVKEKCHAAFITDGDADRIGAAAEDGSFVDSHKIFSILLQWVVTRHKDWPGDVARAFNTTRMLDRIAAKHGRTLIECGIGFKYICDLMLEPDCDWRRRVWSGGFPAPSAGARWAAQCPASGERDGRREARAWASCGRVAV